MKDIRHQLLFDRAVTVFTHSIIWLRNIYVSSSFPEMSLWTILYEILRITWLFLIHVLILAINEVLVTALLHYGIVYFLRGGSRIFFGRGCTRLLLYFNTNKPSSFCCRIPVVLETRRSSQGLGGAHPLHPPPRSAPVPLDLRHTGTLNSFKAKLGNATISISRRPCKAESCFIYHFN